MARLAVEYVDQPHSLATRILPPPGKTIGKTTVTMERMWFTLLKRATYKKFFLFSNVMLVKECDKLAQ